MFDLLAALRYTDSPTRWTDTVLPTLRDDPVDEADDTIDYLEVGRLNGSPRNSCTS